MKATAKKPQRHAALKRLRELCGMTAERFSRLTGIGYAQLVAVEQGRRDLSEIDALIISAATGADPSFNKDKTSRKIKDVDGDDYDFDSFDYWKEERLPDLRGILGSARKKHGLDPMEVCVSNNAKEVMAAARSRGQELPVFHYLQHAIREAAERFDLENAMTSWDEISIKFSPEVVDGQEFLNTKVQGKTEKLPGIGREKDS
jgi:transcriptional regulator with XRE-family HTH domain